MEEKCNKSIKLKDENGVTLIALVVTIINFNNFYDLIKTV